MTRQVAWDEVARAGGLTNQDVTKKTQVLVAGDINPAVLAPGMTTTGKAAKALRLKDKGQDIELMTELDFLRSLEPAETAGHSALKVLEAGDSARGTVAQPEVDGVFYAGLVHPSGRAAGGEPCVKCTGRVSSTLHWVYRDRHVCSDRCNQNLKQQYKRWMIAGAVDYLSRSEALANRRRTWCDPDIRRRPTTT